MDLTLSHESGYVLACTLGPIDETAEREFRSLLIPLVSQAGTQVVLDLSRSSLITSRGIGQLVALTVHANTHSSRIILAAGTSFVSVVLARSKLDRFFEIADTVADAVRQVTEEPLIAVDLVGDEAGQP